MSAVYLESFFYSCLKNIIKSVWFKSTIYELWEEVLHFHLDVKWPGDIVLCLSDCNKRAPKRTIEQRNMVGTRIKILWEEQLADPPSDYITSANAP